jgi:2-polyprenyl-3-methyl-5-hydroxy-6-metoxy-1,4-benzoquinol methylase/O-antigen/teichoic acid export membrane protein
VIPRRFNFDQRFYHQSIWMIFATSLATVLSFSINLVAPWMSMAEYGLLATLIQAATLMMIPAMGLQAVFAMEAAACDSTHEFEQLAQSTIAGSLITGVIWFAIAALAFYFRHYISLRLSIANPASLWMTIVLGLPQLWLPIFAGLLQGRQNFLWLGWSLIANGAGRFCSVIFIVVVLGGQAAGAMTGLLIGTSAALAICIWQTRTMWFHRLTNFRWRSWTGQVLPLTLGLGACQSMMSVDMIFARSTFEVSQTGLYAAAGVIARGIVILTGPIVAVMFPKVVSSLKKGTPIDALSKALKAAAVLGVGLASVCTAVAWAAPHFYPILTRGSWPLSGSFRATLLQHRESVLFIARLVPWFVWSMLPLAIANILVAYLVARRFYWHVAGLGLVAAAYVLSLSMFSGSMVSFIKMIGAFNLLFCLAAATAVLVKAMKTRQISEQSFPSHNCPICSSESAVLFHQNHPGYEQGILFDIYRCPKCDTRFIDTVNLQIDLYDSIYSKPVVAGYDRYARYAVQVLRAKNPLSFLASREPGCHMLYQHLHNKRVGTILDAGCGQGYLVHALRRCGFEAFGVDVSKTAVNAAREKFGDYFFASDIGAFAESHTRRYDAILAFELIEHLKDPLNCLNLLLRLLGPEGVLLLTTPNRDYYRKDAVWHTELPPVHTVWLGRKGIVALAARTGCAYRMTNLADFYPKTENKFAKYLGCRRKFYPMPVNIGSATSSKYPIGTDRSGLRKAANWILHGFPPLRFAGNLLYNSLIRVDDTLALMLRRDDAVGLGRGTPESGDKST